MFKKLAKTIVENSYHDKETNTLFVSNPGISFENLKKLAKKRNFTVGRTTDFNYVSVPISQKYTDFSNGKVTLYDNFMDSYTYYNKEYDTLLSAYKTFDLMDENIAEVDLMLNTYSSEVLSQGFITEPLKIKISNSNAQDLIEKIFYKNHIFQRLPNLVRSIAKYGNYGLTLSYPYLEEWMNSSTETSFDFTHIDVLEDLVISFINPKDFKVNVDEYNNVINYETLRDITFTNNVSATRGITRIWQPWQFVHFSIFDEITQPYGKSMLWSMRSAFDQLTSLEAFLAIARASKIQRLVFYVPVPTGVSMVDAYGYLNEFKTQYLNSVFTDQGSVKGGRKIPGAMSILALPKTANGEKLEVETIESNIDLSTTDDVEYFLDKILRNSNLPKGYLIGDDTITTSQALESQDLKLRRTLIPLKHAVLDGMMCLIENILTHAGYDVSKVDVDVSFNEPIQITEDILSKYSAICTFISDATNLNSNMTAVNKFQLLIKLGIPTDIAGLICSNVNMNSLNSNDDLFKFLHNQKARLDSSDMDVMNESTKYHLNSKQFLNSNTTLTDHLQRIRTELYGTTNRELKESILRSQIKEDLPDEGSAE